MFFIDFHTHTQFNKKSYQKEMIFFQNLTQLDFPAFQNETWREEKALDTGGGAVSCFFSVGLHPYFLTENNFEKDIEILEYFLNHEKYKQKIGFLGEAGLDKLRGPSLQFQANAFEKQIELAEKFQKPVVVHCVKAFNELIEIKKKTNPSVPLIVHGFNKNQHILAQLMRHDFWFSVGFSRFEQLQTGNDFGEMVKKIPLERLFLESDDTEKDVEILYQKIATLKNISIENLQQQMIENLHKITKNQFYTGGGHKKNIL
jgi:TatD DNase family protein